MADSTLNIDWQSSVPGLWVNAAPNHTTSNDHFASAVTNATTKWLNVAVDGAQFSNQTWTSQITYYKMRGMDQVTDGLYATWVVTGAPDFTGAQYSGGLNLPLRAIAIVATWTT